MINISLQELREFFSPAGQQVLIDFIEEAKRTRGANWIEELKREYPNITDILDLVCNQTAGEALDSLKKQFPALRLGFADTALIHLHDRLNAIIDQPRKF